MSDPDDRPGDVSDGEVDELLAAMALDAVDDAERADLEALLAREGPDADAARTASDRYAQAADWLATAAEPVEPSAGLWDQISAQLETPVVAATDTPAVSISVDVDVDADADADVAPADELAERRARRNGWTPMTTLVSVAAAIMLVLVISGAALAISRDSSSGTQDLASAAQDAAAQPGARVADLAPIDGGEGPHAQVVVAADGQTYFVGDGLPALPEDQAYQLWSVSADGEAISVGVLGSNPDVATLSIGSNPGLLAVTVEPSRGSISATTNPLVMGELV